MDKLEKMHKTLGRDTVDEMDKLNEEALKKIIVEASSAMQQVKDELEANPKYKEAKEDLLALTQGKKEVDKRQKARIAYSLYLLSEKGKE